MAGLKLAVLLVLGLAFQRVYADEPERVVGGSFATPGEFPYLVSIHVDGDHYCGGSLIAPDRVLTAAHCIDDVMFPPYKNAYVVSGTVDLKSGGQTHVIKHTIIHPEFINNAASSWANDIAIVVLAGPVPMNKYHKLVRIATQPPPTNAAVTLAGWGRIHVGGPISYQLKKATLHTVDKGTCENEYPDYPIHDTLLCTMSDPGTGACNGDSGSPLLYNNEQVGLLSWLLPCAVGGADVFTKVPSYLDFINTAGLQ